ncbi:hypothetical protein B5E84_04780 [Lachnoclostridium sp. An14]|nr:hypothetical protein B5E84_04780 [Lachnoclostridium sp. An14]
MEAPAVSGLICRLISGGKSGRCDGGSFLSLFPGHSEPAGLKARPSFLSSPDLSIGPKRRPFRENSSHLYTFPLLVL